MSSRHALLVLVALSATAALSAADDARRAASAQSESARPAEKTKPARPRIAVTPEREAAALTFARLHHPELADLLDQLKSRNRKQYATAVRELFETAERLASMQERSAEQYELALELWKLDSRIRLLSAHMTMSDDPELDEHLKQLLRDRLAVRLRQLKTDRERLRQREQRLTERIEQIEADPETLLQQDLQRVKRSAAVAARKQNAEKNPPGARTKAPGRTSPVVKKVSPAEPPSPPPDAGRKER